MIERLPAEAAVEPLSQALGSDGLAVLVAEPGAGKSTLVPIRLLAAEWLTGKIVMLEPRRVAARAVAARLAWHLGEPVGATVGYRVRFDTKVSARTRLEVVTEGVLTRMLADDPTLEDYGLVILDEFHERSIAADAGLALTLETRALVRPDLRVLVMSATIDGAAVAELLGNAAVIEVPGRTYPVENRYRPDRADDRLEHRVARVVEEALAADPGDVLVFLPGVGEIARAEATLAGAGDLGARVEALHGSLPLADQVAILSPDSTRRVILATSIAETSLTIPGVRVVIDAGLMRVPRFSPRTGMARLVTTRVSRAAAEQRRGRAGRTGPGVCYRLWAPGDDRQLLDYTPPEITNADLAPLALDLAAAGVRDPGRLRWLDRPPGGAYRQAVELLAMLGALTEDGRITERGRRLARLPLHPRLGHMVLEAIDAKQGSLAVSLVALLGERDVLRSGGGETDVDLRRRLELVRRGGQSSRGSGDVDHGRLRRVQAEIREWARRLGVDLESELDIESAGSLLAWAYPDRIGQRRPGSAGRFLLRNGRGAFLGPDEPLARVDYLVAVEIDDGGAEGRIRLAAPLDADALARMVASEGVVETRAEFHRGRGSVKAVEVTRLGALVIAERAVRDPDRSVVASALAGAIRQEGIGLLRWGEADVRLRQRLAFLHQLDPGWPDVSDAGLIATLDDWLGPALNDVSSLADLAVAEQLGNLLTWRQRGELDRLAPERYQVPTGSRIAIDYSDPGSPVLAVRLQEMFGHSTTPTIADGAVPLTVHLLSPAGRPLQVTRDLAGFWATSYFDVRKEMRGRYPKHEWPEDPMTATPTRRAKRPR